MPANLCIVFIFTLLALAFQVRNRYLDARRKFRRFGGGGLMLPLAHRIRYMKTLLTDSYCCAAKWRACNSFCEAFRVRALVWCEWLKKPMASQQKFASLVIANARTNKLCARSCVVCTVQLLRLYFVSAADDEAILEESFHVRSISGDAARRLLVDVYWSFSGISPSIYVSFCCCFLCLDHRALFQVLCQFHSSFRVFKDWNINRFFISLFIVLISWKLISLQIFDLIHLQPEKTQERSKLFDRLSDTFVALCYSITAQVKDKVLRVSCVSYLHYLHRAFL